MTFKFVQCKKTHKYFEYQALENGSAANIRLLDAVQQTIECFANLLCHPSELNVFHIFHFEY